MLAYTYQTQRRHQDCCGGVGKLYKLRVFSKPVSKNDTGLFYFCRVEKN
jgi:hypothetical protein